MKFVPCENNLSELKSIFVGFPDDMQKEVSDYWHSLNTFKKEYDYRKKFLHEAFKLLEENLETWWD